MTNDLKGKLIADKYRLEEQVAAGRESDLYRATHVLMEKPVTVSVMREWSDRDAFFERARMAARIVHPNVLNMIDFGTSVDGRVYAVFDTGEGETLKSMIAREGQIEPSLAVDIATQIASALSATHAAGEIHGNLTAEHVLVTYDAAGIPQAKLFGLGTPNAILAVDDVTAATPSEFAYLAPEQCAGGERADARGDIYSLGVILYEMLAGTVPFTGDKPTDVMLKHIEEAPAPLAAFRQDVPAEIEPVMLRALAKDPDLRYQTAEEFANDLNGLTAGTATAAAAAGGGKSIWTTAIMVIVGVGALASALIYATYTTRTEPATVLQSDANGLPVQPINPATGVEEQALASMPISDDSNSAMTMPEVMPGGDGYNPWGGGGLPPGAPEYIPPGGDVYTIPGGGSQFMPNCVPQPSGVMLCYGDPPPNAVPVKPTPTPRTTPEANANVEAKPTPTTSPAATPANTKPSPTRPAATPTPARATPSPDNEGDGPVD
jgi:cell division septation protein DedD